MNELDKDSFELTPSKDSIKPIKLSLKNVLEFHNEHLKLVPLFDMKEINLEQKEIAHSTLIRPQFALAGYLDYFTDKSIVILGRTEASFLNRFDLDEQMTIISKLAKFDIPCVIITNNNENMFDPKIIEIFVQNNIPVFKAAGPTPIILHQLMDIMDDFFSLKKTIHGNLVEVFGVGILILGESGIGKSELTLDLLEKGHRFVADDILVLMRKWGHKVYGYGPMKTQKWIEIRGAGILDVTQMFGANLVENIVEIENVIFLYDDERMIESVTNFMVKDYSKTTGEFISAQTEWNDIKKKFLEIPDHELPSIDLRIYKRIIKYHPLDRISAYTFKCYILGISKALYPLNVSLSKNSSAIIEAIASRYNTKKVGFKLPMEERFERPSSPDNIYFPPNWMESKT